MRKEGGNIEAKRGLQYFTLFPVNKSWEIEEKEERKKYKRKKDEKEEGSYGFVQTVKKRDGLVASRPCDNRAGGRDKTCLPVPFHGRACRASSLCNNMHSYAQTKKFLWLLSPDYPVCA